MRHKFLASLTAIALAALACGAPGSSATATPITAAGLVATQTPPVPTEEAGADPTATGPEATDTPPTEPATSPDELPDRLDLDDPTLYGEFGAAQTYRTALDYRFVGEAADGQPVTGTVLMSGESIVEPYETSLTFYSFGRAVNGDGGVMTFTQTIETQYIVYPGLGCLAGAAGAQQNPFAVFLDLGGMLTGEAQREQPDETINDVDSAVYLISLENIDRNDPAGADVLELTDGRLYVAKDGGFVVRLVFAGRGANEVLSGDPGLPGDLTYALDYLDFDEPVDVEPPAVCATEAEIDSPYPLPDDATEVNELGGIVSFCTGLSVDGAVAFYESEMAALGCQAPQTTGGGSLVQLTFSGCPFGAVNVVLAEDAARGDVIGTITPLP